MTAGLELCAPNRLYLSSKTRKPLKHLLFIYSVCSMFIFALAQDSLSLIPASGYPKWLRDDEYRTDQTSGIAFIGTDEGGKHFLLADDIGYLHRLNIIDDTVIVLHKIILTGEVLKYIEPFPKKDFEEIVFDKPAGRVYLSVEGNAPAVESVVGIYELRFKDDNPMSDTVVSIEKISIQPGDEFLRYTDNNIGFEGLTVDQNYFYAALEGFSNGVLFADSTLIYIIGKEDHQLKKIVSTRGTGIETICGLFSDKNYSLYGVDRNNRKVFHISFSGDLNIESVQTSVIPVSIPDYIIFDYVASLESITMDDENNVYLVDDPWKTFYIPPKDILNQLDEETAGNFKTYVPVIYKFKMNNEED